MDCDWCGGAGCEECTGGGGAGGNSSGGCAWCSGAGCEECGGAPKAAAEAGVCDWCEGAGCDECSGKAKPAASAGSGWGAVRQNSVEIADAGAPFKVLRIDQLEGVRKNTVGSMAEQLDVTEDEADCLLRFFDWDQARLEREWFKDASAVRVTAGVLELKPAAAGKKEPAEVPCVVAYCGDGPREDATRLGCGHWVCNQHWTQLLTVELNGGVTSVLTKCPGMNCVDKKCNHLSKQNCNCKQLVPQTLIRKFVQDEALWKKFQVYVSRRFVEAQTNYRWCISPGCDCVIYYEGGGVEEAECKCGRKLCVACGEAPHVPAPCDLAGKFLATKNSDQATQDLIAATCKQCPKCGVQIQKLEHCSHMNCTNCSHEFCWLCKGSWKSHTQSFFECKDYEQKVKDGLVSAEEAMQVKKQQDLQKFEYYYKLWDQHRVGAKTCEDMCKVVRDGESSARILLLDGLTKLSLAHKTLQWTWCLVYFMAPGQDKSKFSIHQTLLSEKCEELTKQLKDHSKDQWAYFAEANNANVFRAAVSSLASHRQNMINEIENGTVTESLDSKAGQSTTSDGWACTRCGKLHGPGEAREKPPASAVSWTCKFCTFYNEHAGTVCEMCAADRSNGAPPPAQNAGQKRSKEPEKEKSSSKKPGGFFSRKKAEPEKAAPVEEVKSAAPPSSPSPGPSAAGASPVPKGMIPPNLPKGSGKKEKKPLEPGVVPMEWCAECAACRRHGEKECHACVTDASR